MVKRTGERRLKTGRFDALRLAARGDVIEGEVDVAGRERVADLLAASPDPTPIVWRIEGGRDGLERPMLVLKLRGSVPLVCQRCLQRFDQDVDQRSELLIAHDDAELKRLDADEREVVLASEPLDALTLVDDELLLTLPFAPMHPAGQCPAEEARTAGGGETARKGATNQGAPSPFARLAAMKRRPRRT